MELQPSKRRIEAYDTTSKSTTISHCMSYNLCYIVVFPRSLSDDLFELKIIWTFLKASFFRLRFKAEGSHVRTFPYHYPLEVHEIRTGKHWYRLSLLSILEIVIESQSDTGQQKIIERNEPKYYLYTNTKRGKSVNKQSVINFHDDSMTAQTRVKVNEKMVFNLFSFFIAWIFIYFHCFSLLLASFNELIKLFAWSFCKYHLLFPLLILFSRLCFFFFGFSCTLCVCVRPFLWVIKLKQTNIISSRRCSAHTLDIILSIEVLGIHKHSHSMAIHC